MKRIIFIFCLLVFALTLLLLSLLATTGYETDKFNELISKKVLENNKNINLQFEKIKFKFDVKNIKLFLETENPKIKYKDIAVPLKKIKVYLDIIPLIKSRPEIEKVAVLTKEIDIVKLKDISLKFKPSNLTSLIYNKVNKGKFTLDLELYFESNQKISNFIARGEVREFKFQINKHLSLNKTDFNFFFDNSDVLIKNIRGKMEGIKISNGDIQINREEQIKVKSNFESRLELNNNNLRLYKFYFKNKDLLSENTIIKANLNNTFDLVLDKTIKIKDYNFKSQGVVKDLKYYLATPLKNQFLKNNINKIDLRDTDLIAKIGLDKKNSISLVGKYKVNDRNYEEFSFINNFKEKNSDIDFKIKFSDFINVNFINYKKDNNKAAEISTNLKLKDQSIIIKKFNYKENKNNIIIENLKINKDKINSFKKIKIKTFNKGKLNNDFLINFKNSIIIKGTKYDATNLNKILNEKSKNNFFDNISKEIDISLDKIQTPLTQELFNFKLIGIIKKGKFIKISSKGDFDKNKFLDISLKNDNKNKKYLEVYSDIPQALLSEYSFFKGLSGGVLNFSSIIEKNNSTSKLTIENFKIINAPGVVKLLSLADFGGLADLAEGEGLSFEKLEISMSKDQDILNLNELFAVGPSISVLMEGYQNQNGLTSLRGTLVPAKNLNKLLSKIPVIGNIIIPKEVGEGLFGVSFKMKGPPGKIKTTINPIKTLTPRFISKALEKSKKN
tara:strand:- start:753 stop:2939 length:2187 start_codon:yes stop_codon:yes gene_type:complete